MNHSIVDGNSFWKFFNSFSEIFNSQDETNALKNPPIFRQMSSPIICKLPSNPFDESTSPYEPPVWKERMFYFSSQTLKSWKSKANQECGTTNISSLQSLIAFLWRSITKARNLPEDQETSCTLAADDRSRMNPPLPMDYFGVNVSPVKATMQSSKLLENEFGWAALTLHQAVTEFTGEKIVTETNRILNSPWFLQFEKLSNPSNIVVGSSPRFNKYGCEFGMGKAVAARSGYGWKFDGKVFAYPGREGGGSIYLEVCLLPEFMEALESD